MASYDRLVQYTRARHLTQPPTARSEDADIARERAAEPAAAAPRQRKTRWDVREGRRRPVADQHRDIIDLTEQTPPGSPVTIAGTAAAASANSSASGRSPSPRASSGGFPRQRLRESDSAKEPRCFITTDSSRRSRPSGRSSPGRRSSRSPEQHRRRLGRRQTSSSRSRSRNPTRLPATAKELDGRRSCEADQRRARFSTDVSCAGQGSMPPVGRDVRRLQHSNPAAREHDLAAAELRRLRERALQGMPSAQPQASLMHEPSGDDRWEME